MGRSTREQARANRERVLTEAARLLNERGLAGVGVAELMAAAGLTHGGFYVHFGSKEDAVAAAAERAAHDVAAQWASLGEARGAAHAEPGASGPGALGEILARYLSAEHRDAPGGGCTVAALGPELARLPAEHRARVAGGVEAMVDALAATMPGADPAERRRAALTALGTMIGAVILARLGVGGPDDPLRLAADHVGGVPSPRETPTGRR